MPYYPQIIEKNSPLKSFFKTVGDNIASSFIVDHQLNSPNVSVIVRQLQAPGLTTPVGVECLSLNTVKISFGKAPQVNEYQTVISSFEQISASNLVLPQTGLVGAWQSDVGVSIENFKGSTTIRKIIDQSDVSSTGANDAFQENRINQPQFINDGLNGYPVIRFNGTSAFLKTAGTLCAARMMIIVFRQNIFNDYDGIFTARTAGFSSKNLPSNENIGITGLPNKINVNGIANSTSVFLDGVAQNVNDYNDYLIGTLLKNNTEFHLIETVQSSSIIGEKYWVIGADTYQDVRFFNGDIAMIAIYDVADDTTRLAARAYIKEKYNLPI